MTSQLLSYWCFVGDGLLPRYVMQTTVRFCTSAKQDDVERISPTQLAPNEQSMFGSTTRVIGLPTAVRGGSDRCGRKADVFACFELATLKISDYRRGSAVA